MFSRTQWSLQFTQIDAVLAELWDFIACMLSSILMPLWEQCRIIIDQRARVILSTATRLK